MKVPRQDQGCYCPVCHKLFTTSIVGTYLVPPHTHAGNRCDGEGLTVRLMSAGMYGGPGFVPIKNGSAPKMKPKSFGHHVRNEY
jgi:hypothetical protein